MKTGERMKSNLNVNKDLASLLLCVYLVILATNLWTHPSHIGMVVPDSPEVSRMIVPDAPEVARMVVPDGPE
jgi:hypothetical protein